MIIPKIWNSSFLSLECSERLRPLQSLPTCIDPCCPHVSPTFSCCRHASPTFSCCPHVSIQHCRRSFMISCGTTGWHYPWTSDIEVGPRCAVFITYKAAVLFLQARSIESGGCCSRLHVARSRVTVYCGTITPCRCIEGASADV